MLEIGRFHRINTREKRKTPFPKWDDSKQVGMRQPVE